MNSRKAKVSKVSWLLLAPAFGLLGTTPAPRPLQLSPAAPPRDGRSDYGQARDTGNCANARRELRFEMLSVTEPQPPPRRSPVVCLAVFRPAQDPQDLP